MSSTVEFEPVTPARIVERLTKLRATPSLERGADGTLYANIPERLAVAQIRAVAFEQATLATLEGLARRLTGWSPPTLRSIGRTSTSTT